MPLPRRVYVMLKLLRARRSIANLLNDTAAAAAANSCIDKWARLGAFKGLGTMTGEAEALFAESMACVHSEIGSFRSAAEIDWIPLFKAATEAAGHRTRLLELI